MNDFERVKPDLRSTARRMLIFPLAFAALVFVWLLLDQQMPTSPGRVAPGTPIGVPPAIPAEIRYTPSSLRRVGASSAELENFYWKLEELDTTGLVTRRCIVGQASSGQSLGVNCYDLQSIANDNAFQGVVRLDGRFENVGFTDAGARKARLSNGRTAATVVVEDGVFTSVTRFRPTWYVSR